MTFRKVVYVAGVIVLGAVLAAPGKIDTKADQEPRYNTASVVTIEAVVVEVHETGKGMILTVKGDSDAAVAVYLGPVAFVKSFEITFRKGDRIHITGSKVKSGDESLVLAREVRKDSTTLYLRGKNGDPYW